MKSPRTKSESCSFWSITERSATAGVKFSTMTLRPSVSSPLGLSSIPKACSKDPATCLNFGIPVSAKQVQHKESHEQGRHIGKRAIQAGAPLCRADTLSQEDLQRTDYFLYTFINQSIIASIDLRRTHHRQPQDPPQYYRCPDLSVTPLVVSSSATLNHSNLMLCLAFPDSFGETTMPACLQVLSDYHLSCMNTHLL